MTPTRYPLSETIRIDTPEGVIGAYVARPDPPVRAAVVVGMELFGVTAHVRDVCDRLAAAGYLAIAPDLYHRSAPGTELPADDTGRARGFALLGELTRAQALDDIAATMTWVEDRQLPLAGMVGLSVGGHVAYLAATRFPLPVVSIFYGGWLSLTHIPLSQPDPTLAGTAQITGQIQIFVGTNDTIVPAEHRQQIRHALTTAHIHHDLIEYPHVGHGFLCDRRPSYHPQAANDAWHRLLHLLDHVAPTMPNQSQSPL